MRRVMIAGVVAALAAAVVLLALSVQNGGCLPWQERVSVGDGVFGPQDDFTACR